MSKRMRIEVIERITWRLRCWLTTRPTSYLTLLCRTCCHQLSWSKFNFGIGWVQLNTQSIPHNSHLILSVFVLLLMNCDIVDLNNVHNTELLKSNGEKEKIKNLITYCWLRERELSHIMHSQPRKRRFGNVSLNPVSVSEKLGNWADTLPHKRDEKRTDLSSRVYS